MTDRSACGTWRQSWRYWVGWGGSCHVYLGGSFLTLSFFFFYFLRSFFCVVLSFPITMLIPGGQGPEVGVTEALLCCFFFVCFFSWLDHYSCSKSSLCYLEGWLFFFGKIKVFCSFLSKQHGFSKGSCKETIYYYPSSTFFFLFFIFYIFFCLSFITSDSAARCLLVWIFHILYTIEHCIYMHDI